MNAPVLEATLRLEWKDRWSVLAVSGEIEALLGYSPAVLLASQVTLRERIHAHDADIAEMLFSPQNKKDSGSFNIRLRQANGRIRLVHGEFSRELSEDGKITLDLRLQDAKGLCQDLGALSTIPNFRAMMENTEDYIYFKDRNHVFTGASQTLVSLTSPIENWKDLLGKTDYDVFPEEYADIYYKLEKDVFAGIAAAHEVQETLTKDGQKGWVDNRKYPIHDAAGQVIGLWGIARDITERVRVEETLRQSEETLRESQAIAGIGSYAYDIRAGVWISSEVMDGLFGIDRSYIRSVDGWTALIHPEERETMAAYLASEVVGQGKTFDHEYRIIRQSDGAVRWVHGMGRLDKDDQGRPWRLRGTIQDITERKIAEASLRESKDLLQQFFEHAPAALAIFDREMRYMTVSKRWLEDYSLEGQQIIGKRHYDVVPDIPERWKEGHRRGLAGETLRADEERFERADGSVNWVRWEQLPWYLSNGEVGGIILFAEDITRHKVAEESLNLAASVFTNAREAIMITAADGSILDVNETFTQITGYTRAEVLGQNPRILKSGRQSEEFYEALWKTLRETGQWSGEIWNRAKSGHVFPVLLTLSAVREDDGSVQHYVALYSDISALKEHERKLEHIALHDVLTGLPNRVFMADRMHKAMLQCLRRQLIMAVAYLDLDAFKAVNDTHGHDIGDQLLTVVSRRMKHVLRDGDTLARLGGDEFVAVLLDLDEPEDSVPVLMRLLEAASQPVQIHDLNLQVSASIGVTFFSQREDVDADQLLRQADHAMYHAKLGGRNRYHFFDASGDRVVNEQSKNAEAD